MDPLRPAVDVWTVRRKPVDILGRLMVRLDFQLKGWEIYVHHQMFRTMEEADAECRRIGTDLHQLTDGRFRAKYRIGYDLRGGF